MAAPQDQLRRIEKLRSEGLLTDEEYQSRRAAVLDRLTAEPPLPQRAFRWRLFGCLGIAAAVGIVWIGIIATAIAFVFGDDDDARGGRGLDVRVELTPGTTAVVESWDDAQNGVRLVGIHDPAPASDEMTALPGHRLVSFEVEIENLREDYTPGHGGGDFGTSLMLHGRDDEIRVPHRVRSIAVFEVPDGVTIDWFAFNPTLLGGTLYFEAR